MSKIGKIVYKQIITFQKIIYHLIDLNIDWDEVEIESCYTVSTNGRYKLGPCGNFRNFNVTLKLKLQSSYFPQRKITHASYAHSVVLVWSDLPLPSYKSRYVKNAGRSP